MKKRWCFWGFIVMILTLSLLCACDNTGESGSTDNSDTTEETTITTEETTSDSEGTTADTEDTTKETEETTAMQYIAPELPLPESNVSPEDVVKAIDPNVTASQFGYKTWQVVLSDTTISEMKDAFVSAGYTEVVAPTVSGSDNAPVILGAGNLMITMRQEKSDVRIECDICDPSTFALLFPNETTGTGEVMMAQIGVERNLERDNPMNGMCYIYKLSDGRAVILDGGHNSNSHNVYSALQKMDIAKDENGRYRIAAWILSHGHGDHYGALITFSNSEYSQLCDVESFVYSLPLDETILSSASCHVPSFVAWISQYFPNAKHVVPHAGLQYHFGNLTLDMLYTPDMLSDIDYENNTSLVFIADCGETRVLHMGDAGDKVAKFILSAYKADTLKAQILQIAHHGLYTGANESHSWTYLKKLYKVTQAEYAVLPMGTRSPVDSRNGRHTVIIAWASMGFQTSFLMDTHATTTNLVAYDQDTYDQFVSDVAAGKANYETICGYNGKNIIYNSGTNLTTYIMSTETENMATVFSISQKGISVVANELLSEWFAQ